MDEILAAALSRAVHDRLDQLNAVVHAADERSLSALADAEIVRLTETVRELLAQHAPDAHGCCRQCSGWFRRRHHPCSVWTVAHQHLVGPHGTPPGGHGRHVPTAGRRSVATLELS